MVMPIVFTMDEGTCTMFGESTEEPHECSVDPNMDTCNFLYSLGVEVGRYYG